jgi:hypothetical protein
VYPDSGNDMSGGYQAPQQQYQSSQEQAPQGRPVSKQYINPATGEPFTPEEYVNSVFKAMPNNKGNGDVGQYAGDALTNPDESSQGLNTRATNMNNARNDIATGATNPYDTTEGGKIVYSPQEREAIQKAYAGVYDPALNDVFSRLKTREDEEKRKADREDKIFATNESIRQWKSTTGSKSSGSDSGLASDIFTQSQLNSGATKADMTIEEFSALDSDIANYYVNPPKVYDTDTGKSSLVSDNMVELMKEVTDGILTNEEAAKEIMAGDLPPTVKVFLVNQLPATPEEKDGWMKSILNWIW